MKTSEYLFKFGIILALAGICVLFGALTYEAFQKSLERGLEVMGFVVLIFGTALAFISYLNIPADYFKKKEE